MGGIGAAMGAAWAISMRLVAYEGWVLRLGDPANNASPVPDSA